MQLEVIVSVAAFAWVTLSFIFDGHALSMEREAKRLSNLYLRIITGKQDCAILMQIIFYFIWSSMAQVYVRNILHVDIIH